MDIRMPVLDGLEATRQIRALPDGQKTAIIAVTASVFEEERAEVLAVARGFEVTGYAQNLPDGRVLVHAEGSEREVEDFLAAGAERLEGHIRGVEARSFVGLRTCPRFEIRT
jgi:CheY-like chemotaxis protein